MDYETEDKYHEKHTCQIHNMKVYHTMCHVNLGAHNIEILNAVENNKELPHFTY